MFLILSYDHVTMTVQQHAEVQEVTTVSNPTSERVVRQTKVISPTVETGSPQKTYETKKAIFRSYQFIWYLLGVIEVLLAFRVILKLMGANTSSGFFPILFLEY